MSFTCDWEEVDSPEKNKQKTQNTKGKNDIWMKLPEGEHQIRLVGKPVKRHVAWLPRLDDPNRNAKFLVPPEFVARIESAFPDIDIKMVYAICCFDRADTANGITRLKVLEKGNTIFEPFKMYKRKFKDKDGNPIEPGGKHGPDWSIEASIKTINGKKEPRNTKYNIMPLQETPFTEAELKFLNQNPMDEENQKKPLGERGFYDEHKHPYVLKVLFNLDEHKKKLTEYFEKRDNSGPLDSSEEVSDFGGPEEVTSLDDLTSPDKNNSTEVESQLEEVF